LHEIQIESFDDRADLRVAQLAKVVVAVAAHALVHPRNMSLADCIRRWPATTRWRC
jgi:hypothetical protein